MANIGGDEGRRLSRRDGVRLLYNLLVVLPWRSQHADEVPEARCLVQHFSGASGGPYEVEGCSQLKLVSDCSGRNSFRTGGGHYELIAFISASPIEIEFSMAYRSIFNDIRRSSILPRSAGLMVSF